MELQIKLALLFLFLSFPIPTLSFENEIRFELTHVDSKQNLSNTERIQRAMVRTTHRIARLNGAQLFLSTSITSLVHSDGNTLGEYFMDLAIGTPTLKYSAIVDTGSDLVWTQCQPCQKCVSQPTTIYNPSNSTSVDSVPCNSPAYISMCSDHSPPPSCYCSYNYTYGTGWTSGVLGQETFTFGATKLVQVTNLIFGCSTSTSDQLKGSAGLVGLGRGALSLVSQVNGSMFSYCLTSFFDTQSTSPFILGPSATFGGSAVKSTPFVTNPSTYPTFYYLSLQGISLGSNNLAIKSTSFSLNSNGDGGVIIDSGTTFTALTDEAYQAVKKGIKSIVNLKIVNGSNIGFDLCYSLSNGTAPSMPNMTFHFKGADMELSVNNYMLTDQDYWCLAMSNTSNSMSIFGNYQQQNMHILYDLAKGVLSFMPTQCDKL